MCGIIGYVGKKAASPILLEGLRRLMRGPASDSLVAELDRLGCFTPRPPGECA